MAATLWTLAQFQNGYEAGIVTEVFSVTVNTEKRLYGKTFNGRGALPFKTVYCVVP